MLKREVTSVFGMLRYQESGNCYLMEQLKKIMLNGDYQT